MHYTYKFFFQIVRQHSMFSYMDKKQQNLILRIFWISVLSTYDIFYDLYFYRITFNSIINNLQLIELSKQSAAIAKINYRCVFQKKNSGRKLLNINLTFFYVLDSFKFNLMRKTEFFVASHSSKF